MTGMGEAIDRRGLLTGALAGAATLALTPWGAPPSALASSEAVRLVPCPPPGWRTSLSVISPFSEEDLAALAYTDGVVTARTLSQLQHLYERHGATEVYMRIATKKVAGKPNGVTRASFARMMGLPYNPELGLFGTYGDAATYQDPPDFSDYSSIRLPGPWLSLTIEEMLPAMRAYGALAAREILATGVRVEYWDLGNEVENGISGVCVYPFFPISNYTPPDNVDPAIGTMSTAELIAMPESERISWCEMHLWPYVGKLLAAAADGIRSVVPHAKFSTHVSDFGQRSPAVQLAFWDCAAAQGYIPDLFGTSYYPTDGRTDLGATDRVAWLRGIAAGLHAKYKRQMFISEYGYPSDVMQPPYIFNDTVTGYPQTPQGQYDFTRDLAEWGLTTGLLAGIRPWAPDFCTNSGWAPMSWFTSSGAVAYPKPALHAIQDAIAAKAAHCPTLRGKKTSLLVRSHGWRPELHGVLITLQTRTGVLGPLIVELRRGTQVLAHARLPHLGTRPRNLLLRPHDARLAAGRYELTVLDGHRLLFTGVVRIANHP